MNQILFLKDYKRKKLFYLFILIALILSILGSVIYNLYISYRNKRILNSLKSSYEIVKLYHEDELNEDTNIIGKIIIDKVNIDYPIFKNYTEELLEISICKFYGPSINEVGNLCLVGHNYNDARFFGNLFKLNIGDNISLINNKRCGNKVCYL